VSASLALPGHGAVGPDQRRWRTGVTTGLAYAVLIAVTIASVYPLVLMAINSLKGNNQVEVNSAGLPHPWTLESYRSMVSHGALRSFGNSLLVAGLTTVGAVFISGLAGYSFAKLRFPGRTVLFAGLLGTIMVPIQTALPGFYTEFARFHWIDSYEIQIVPFLAPVFGVFIVRQYLFSVPDDFIEAARLDGATEWGVYWRIIVPVLRPILAALAVLEFLAMWNNYLWPQVMASTQNVAPLSVTLPTYTDSVLGIIPLYGTIMAGNILATIPLVVLFLRYQDLFMRGVAYDAG
jgi:ABC-type glycerol-3-phosphate transport system permease component